jgi:hypothetical protein
VILSLAVLLGSEEDLAQDGQSHRKGAVSLRMIFARTSHAWLTVVRVKITCDSVRRYAVHCADLECERRLDCIEEAR